MSIIDAVRAYILTYSGLKTGAPLWVDFLGPSVTQYSIVPLGGSRIAERYLDGGSKREYTFAFQSMESTADELSRIDTQNAYEAFADWIDAQNQAEIYPDFGSKKHITWMEATGWAVLMEQGQSETGIYHIQLKINYEQEA